MSFESLRKILSVNIQASQGRSEMRIAHIFEACRATLQELWGEERAAFVRCSSFKEGSLRLETSSAAAAQEIRIQGAGLRNAMNRRLGSLVVREIVVSLR